METRDTAPPPISAARAVGGGVLMGLANIVPGVSGGTMILALGLYDRFIAAIADVTRLRPKRASLLLLGLIGLGAAAALVTLSGVAVHLVTDFRWGMYSLFIGMTLGGAPELVRLSRPFGAAAGVAFLVCLGVMALLAWGLASTHIPETIPVLVGVGALAASSMILPGVSGSYLLLILGMYDVVVGAVSARALLDDPGESLGVIVPVAVGALLGVGLLSNILKHLLARFPAPSHAALLGLLVGSVFGLWPFRASVHPELADRSYRKAIVMVLEGADAAEVRAARGVELDADELARLRADYAGMSAGDVKALADELEHFAPRWWHVLAALGLFGSGFLTTRLLGRKEAPGGGAQG